MFNDFAIDKIARQVRLLKNVRYRDMLEIDNLTATEEPEGTAYPCFITPDTSSKEIRKGEFWSGRDRYMWIHCETVIPGNWKDKTVVGLFDLGKTGAGYNRGFESLLFLNGEPYQGVDTNHMEVFLDPSLCGKKVSFDFRLWSGLEGGGAHKIQYHQVNTAALTTLDHSIDALYYLLSNIIESIRILSDNDYTRHALQYVLIETYKIVNFNEHLDSEEFALSAEKALLYCEKQLEMLKKEKDVTVSCVGHTHIDLAWLWRYKHTREKAQRSFMTVQRLMEKYPEYIFIQTQAQLYESVKEDYPQLYEMIRKKIKENRWEASGGMWVEADCNIPSGESLTRQILYGKRYFKNEFGVENTFLWLPDVFGYSWALPQILKKAGIDTFITTKISWNEINRMPHDTFIWKGIDGTEVLTHFITTPDEAGVQKFYTYNGHIYPRTLQGIWDTYQDKGLNQELLLSYGYGDGGGGVTRDMLENIRATGKIPSLPKVSTTTVTDYVKRLHETVAKHNDKRNLHRWSKELYLEFHRGTYTSQADVKKMNRKLELLYREAELMESLNSLQNGKWDADVWKALQRGWKLILKNQFHDIIPGSSITEVYEDTAKEHQTAYEIGLSVVENALDKMVSASGDSITVTNTTPWKRSGYVLCKSDVDTCYLDADGKDYLSQSLSDGNVMIYLPSMEAMKSLTLMRRSRGETVQQRAFEVEKGKIETPYYTLLLNDEGQITSLFDKQAQREVLSGIGNELQIFEDRPRNHDAWEIEASIDDRKEIVDDLQSITVKENGQLCTKIEFVWKYRDSTIMETLVLYAHHKRIDFVCHVDWKERNKLLKVAFPVDIHASNARYDIQYGSLERSTGNSTSWEQAQFEVVGHQWADVQEKDFGVALMNDSKYGYDIKDSVMRLSLLKGAEHPDVKADLKEHDFTYSLFVHDSVWYESDLIPLAWDLNSPLTAIEGTMEHQLPLHMEDSRIAIDAIKKSEDGNDVIIRFHELYGGRTRVKIDSRIGDLNWCEVDLLEQPVSEPQRGTTFEKDVKPFEIVTLKLSTIS